MKALLLSLALAVLPAVVARADEIADLRAALERAEERVAAAERQIQELRAEVTILRHDREKLLRHLVTLTELRNTHRMGLLSEAERLLREVEDQDAAKEDKPRTGISSKRFVTAVGDGNLIELSLGADDMIRAGQIVQIYRDGEPVCRATIQRVTPNRSIASCEPNSKVRKGDTVTQHLDHRERLNQLLNAIDRRGES